MTTNSELSHPPYYIDPNQMANAIAAGSAAAAQAHHYYPTHYFYPETTTTDFRPTFYNPFEIKHRRRTSRAQLKVLEKSFLENAKPNASVRRYLAQELDMTPRGVQIWFQNRRAKAKLQKRKSQQQQQQQLNTSFATPMDDIKSIATQAAAWMNDWMSETTTMPQRRQSCPLWNNEQPPLLTRRASEFPLSPSAPLIPTVPWMDSTDGTSCSGSSSCGTPGWSLDSIHSFSSPLPDHPTLLDLYPQQQQQQQQQQHIPCGEPFPATPFDLML